MSISNTSRRFWIETLKEEIKSVVLEEHEVEDQNHSIKPKQVKVLRIF